LKTSLAFKCIALQSQAAKLARKKVIMKVDFDKYIDGLAERVYKR
jgi:hypothetical protein